MTVRHVHSVGGKDLRDLKGLSRAPALNYAKRQTVPDAPRDKAAPPQPSLFHPLKMFKSAWGWIVEYAAHRLGSRHPFADYSQSAPDNGIYPLSRNDEAQVAPVRIAVAGDWGSGTDEAFTVAKLIAARKPNFTIHLGDVYFVGDDAEVNENFLGQADQRRGFTACLWPTGTDGAFALCGNHEMYARGRAYFELILPALGMTGANGPQRQKASFFCLENKYWRVIGLDTGYNSIGIPVIENISFIENFWRPDCALPDKLIAWLGDVLKQGDDARGIVLLSHHQYYSAFDLWYVKPAEQLAAFIKRPVIWLWGHEHRLAVYEAFQTGKGITAFGRCIGHGGMPVDLPGAIKHTDCKVEFVDDRLYQSDEHLKVGVNGFAELTFEGPALKIDYVDIEDAVIFSESWTVNEKGEVARRAARAGAPEG
jgi:hypothetical protein